VVPGRNAAHATSAARYLEECLAGAETPGRILEFLDKVPVE
jgi:hypothetical protein